MNLRSSLRPLFACAVLMTCPAMAADPLAGYPSFRPGLWEMTRSPMDAPPGAKKFVTRECTNPTTTLARQSAELAVLGCKTQEPKHSGKTYTFGMVCDIPKTGKTTSKSLLLRESDSAYTVTIHTEGETNGKPVNATDVISMRRVGDCPKK
ncbi:MAG: DUF3617 family protein [Burkholderiales bacterium]